MSFLGLGWKSNNKKKQKKIDNRIDANVQTQEPKGSIFNRFLEFIAPPQQTDQEEHNVGQLQENGVNNTLNDQVGNIKSLNGAEGIGQMKNNGDDELYFDAQDSIVADNSGTVKAWLENTYLPSNEQLSKSIHDTSSLYKERLSWRSRNSNQLEVETSVILSPQLSKYSNASNVKPERPLQSKIRDIGTPTPQKKNCRLSFEEATEALDDSNIRPNENIKSTNLKISRIKKPKKSAKWRISQMLKKRMEKEKEVLESQTIYSPKMDIVTSKSPFSPNILSHPRKSQSPSSTNSNHVNFIESATDKFSNKAGETSFEESPSLKTRKEKQLQVNTSAGTISLRRKQRVADEGNVSNLQDYVNLRSKVMDANHNDRQPIQKQLLDFKTTNTSTPNSKKSRLLIRASPQEENSNLIRFRIRPRKNQRLEVQTQILAQEEEQEQEQKQEQLGRKGHNGQSSSFVNDQQNHFNSPLNRKNFLQTLPTSQTHQINQRQPTQQTKQTPKVFDSKFKATSPPEHFIQPLESTILNTEPVNSSPVTIIRVIEGKNSTNNNDFTLRLLPTSPPKSNNHIHKIGEFYVKLPRRTPKPLNFFPTETQHLHSLNESLHRHEKKSKSLIPITTPEKQTLKKIRAPQSSSLFPTRSPEMVLGDDLQMILSVDDLQISSPKLSAFVRASPKLINAQFRPREHEDLTINKQQLVNKDNSSTKIEQSQTTKFPLTAAQKRRKRIAERAKELEAKQKVKKRKKIIRRGNVSWMANTSDEYSEDGEIQEITEARVRAAIDNKKRDPNDNERNLNNSPTFIELAETGLDSLHRSQEKTCKNKHKPEHDYQVNENDALLEKLDEDGHFNKSVNIGHITNTEETNIGTQKTATDLSDASLENEKNKRVVFNLESNMDAPKEHEEKNVESINTKEFEQFDSLFVSESPSKWRVDDVGENGDDAEKTKKRKEGKDEETEEGEGKDEEKEEEDFKNTEKSKELSSSNLNSKYMVGQIESTHDSETLPTEKSKPNSIPKTVTAHGADNIDSNQGNAVASQDEHLSTSSISFGQLEEGKREGSVRDFATSTQEAQTRANKQDDFSEDSQYNFTAKFFSTKTDSKDQAIGIAPTECVESRASTSSDRNGDIKIFNNCSDNQGEAFDKYAAEGAKDQHISSCIEVEKTISQTAVFYQSLDRGETRHIDHSVYLETSAHRFDMSSVPQRYGEIELDTGKTKRRNALLDEGLNTKEKVINERTEVKKKEEGKVEREKEGKVEQKEEGQEDLDKANHTTSAIAIETKDFSNDEKLKKPSKAKNRANQSRRRKKRRIERKTPYVD